MIMYTGVLTLDLSTSMATIDFVTFILREVGIYAYKAVYDIKTKFENVGLSLPERGTEVVLICEFININVVSQTIHSQLPLEDWVKFKLRLNFKLHTKDAVTKAYKTEVLFVRILSNIGGTRPSYSRIFPDEQMH